MINKNKIKSIPSNDILDKVIASGVDYRVLESVLQKIACASGKVEESLVLAIMSYEIAKKEYDDCLSGAVSLPLREKWRIVLRMRECYKELNEILLSLGRDKYPP